MADPVILLSLEGTSPELVTELEQIAPNAQILTSENFLAGFDATVFLPVLGTVVSAVLLFITANRDRVKKGSISVGPRKIDISGMTPEEARAFLALPEIQAVLHGKRG